MKRVAFVMATNPVTGVQPTVLLDEHSLNTYCAQLSA